MNKGCFLSIIISLTILVVGIFYFVKYYGEDLLEKGKVQLVKIAEEQINTNISELDENQYKDSLKIVVEKYFNDIDTVDIKSELELIERFVEDIEVILMDSQIDSAEYNFIKNLAKKYE